LIADRSGPNANRTRNCSSGPSNLETQKGVDADPALDLTIVITIDRSIDADYAELLVPAMDSI
jgi:hypothetical protein